MIDCITVPGGEELNYQNLEEQYKWEQEKAIPKERGAKIMTAISSLLNAPNHEIMLKRKQAIHEGINRVKNEKEHQHAE